MRHAHQTLSGQCQTKSAAHPRTTRTRMVRGLVSLLAATTLQTIATAQNASSSSPGVRVITGETSAQAAAGAASGASPLSAKVMARDPRVLKVLDTYVEYQMREDPISASIKGDTRFNDQLRDESPAAYTRRAAEVRGMLAEARGIPRAGLTAEDLLDLDLLIYELTLATEFVPLMREQAPINSMDGPHVWLPQLADQVPVRTPQQLNDYVTRLTKIPLQIDQLIEQMKLGLATGNTPPRVVMKHVVAGARTQADPAYLSPQRGGTGSGTRSPFYRPLHSADAALQERALLAIEEGIVPAYSRLADFLQNTYIPGCRESIGFSQSAAGQAGYNIMLRHFTTTDLTAEQIHAIGLSEVARLRSAMSDVIDRTDWPDKDKFTSSPDSANARFAAFLAYLRSDPRFYYTDAEEMLRDYRDICKRIDSQLPTLFRTLPRNTYGVRAIPKFAALTSPAAYCYPGSIRSGVPGYFMVNTHNLSQRPKYGMISLTMHEACPGHHFQIAIADELESVHQFRTLTSYTAYVEGWALYTEQLGLEMDPLPGLRSLNTLNTPSGTGFYTDAYDDFGRLSDEIWRAARLVVDTGMHAQGWTRQQALDYMLANTAGTELDLNSEIDRYISWPGQACAYKIGQIAISRLRSRAEETLKEAFDLRAFHDVILSGGALPMPVLEQRVDRWIAGKSLSLERK